MTPLIGITPMFDHLDNKSFVKYGYQEAVIEAGGIPIIIPITSRKDILYHIFLKLDGIILTGGSDVDPKYFNQEPSIGTNDISPIRDEMEIYLSQQAIKHNKPIFGICRGCQVLNVSMGGSIYQDIYSETPTTLKHCQNAPKWYATHDINIVEGSIHEKLFKAPKIRVNSFHHQAIKDLASGFIISAYASDGIIEAIEYNQCSFCVGVQYHPELMWEKERKFLHLFIQLIKSSSGQG